MSDRPPNGRSRDAQRIRLLRRAEGNAPVAAVPPQLRERASRNYASAPDQPLAAAFNPLAPRSGRQGRWWAAVVAAAALATALFTRGGVLSLLAVGVGLVGLAAAWRPAPPRRVDASRGLVLAQQFDQWWLQAEALLNAEQHPLAEQLRARLARLLPEVASLQALDPESAHCVEQTVQRYLPDALRPYAALAVEQRSAVGTNGESPAAHLRQQLADIDAGLAQCEAALVQHHQRALSVHTRFLRNKRHQG